MIAPQTTRVTMKLHRMMIEGRRMAISSHHLGGDRFAGL
jgi:hypothetical protein